MNIIRKLMQAYFNYAYNPVYDFVIGQLNLYRQLQATCVGKLELEGNDSVLCVGVGTGNEILHILQTNRNISIVGIDHSHTALQKAYRKAAALGKEIELLIMDARLLQFPAKSFDKVLCIHLMDFVKENEKVTNEILRVLKDGGQFVITYPSDKEGPRLGINLLSNNVRHGITSGKLGIITLLESLARMLVGVIYLPLLFRPKRKPYSRTSLEAMISQSNNVNFHIEEYSLYQDFILYGKKSSKGEK